jgi:hypothetical protein
MMMTKRCASALAVLALLLLPALARADGNLSYDDPAVHYNAPDGWTRIDIPAGSEDAPTALFRKEFTHYDVRAISLKIDKWAGSLDGFESSTESDMRSQNQDMFVDKKTKVTLSNGMPAWQVKYTYGSSAGSIVRGMEYMAFDGRRGIILSYAGRSGAFDDKEALAALSTLTVVLYPEDR